MPAKVRCIDCRRQCTQTRCTSCQRARDRARNHTRPQYAGDYQQRRTGLINEAHATGAPCWICGHPLQPDAAWPHPLTTTADHVRPGDPTSPLAPAHLGCNSARGNRT